MGETGKHTGNGYILLGKITKPHGIRGELKVLSYTEQLERFKRYDTLYLSRDDGKSYLPYTREKMRLQGTSVILKLKGCDDRNSAETLVGCKLSIEEKELPPPEEGEFYLYELEGKEAFDTEGKRIGTIASVLIGQGQDLLQIISDSGEVLVPLVSEFLVERDDVKIVLDLPQGLLEIYQ